MDVNIGIEKADRKAIADALSRVLADTYMLYQKTHAYHWNVTGPLFSSLHALFMTQYTELHDAADLIAERIRALGHYAPGSYSKYAALTAIAEDTGDAPPALDMVRALAEGHETLARTLREAFKPAENAGDSRQWTSSPSAWKRARKPPGCCAAISRKCSPLTSASPPGPIAPSPNSSLWRLATPQSRVRLLKADARIPTSRFGKGGVRRGRECVPRPDASARANGKELNGNFFEERRFPPPERGRSSGAARSAVPGGWGSHRASHSRDPSRIVQSLTLGTIRPPLSGEGISYARVLLTGESRFQIFRREGGYPFEFFGSNTEHPLAPDLSP